MKKIFGAFIVVLFVALMHSANALATTKNIFITEVQTGGVVSASEEFVEIYNSTETDIDITGWSMYYKSATGTSWTKKATVTIGSIKSKAFWVFSANLEGNTAFSSGLSGTGGNIQIRDKAGNIVDQFGWGNANASLGTPASISSAGQSMYRVYDFEKTVFINNDNNFVDFDIAEKPTPSKVPIIELPGEDTEPEIYPKLELSELFPDPNGSLIDSSDEFVEIFNPNTEEVDLTGWKIHDESGSEYLIKDIVVPPNSRVAIYTKLSKITLNNTGDVIQLIDPNGKIADESADYGSAEPGLSWSKIDGLWYWAVSATPGAINSEKYVEEVAVPTTTIAKIKKTTKKVSSAKPSSKSAGKSSKTSKASPGVKLPAITNNTTGDKKSNLTWWPWLLVALGIATIGYAIYEYKSEIQLFIRKLRRYK